MNEPVVVPLWLVVLVAALALWTVGAKVLAPGVRWFLRRRANRLIAELNTRLRFKIPKVTQTRRQYLIDRLTYDAEVVEAAEAVCREQDLPRDMIMERVASYAREIVPAFNPYVYFNLVSGLCRAALTALYRVRKGYIDEAGIRNIDPHASVVIVINHRSNVDYLLVTTLAVRAAALSYAVGEWARVWPLQQIIRALGGYFVRRSSGNPLYRKVLERYVQISLEAGAVQAVFPEGGLSRDGKLREPRIGLLDYMLRKFDLQISRDIVFIPVGVNYDRVLEDRTLLLDLDPEAERRTGWSAIVAALDFVRHGAWQRLRGRRFKYGYACANFGTPISLKAHLEREGWCPSDADRETRVAGVQRFAHELMRQIGALIPVLPVSAVAHLLLQRGDAGTSVVELRAETKRLLESLILTGAHVYLPREDLDYAIEVGLRMLTLRRLVHEGRTGIFPAPGEEPLLQYYANAIEHLVGDEATSSA